MRSAFQKLVASKITFDILTSDKFEYANDAPDKSAPARLLFLILVTLATYTFMPWKGIDKGSLVKVASQWFMWFTIFAIIVLISTFFGIEVSG